MKKTILTLLSIGIICMGCSKTNNNDGPDPATVKAPSDIKMERTGATEVRVSWIDNSSNETGFSVWVRSAADATDRWEAGTVGANVTSYTVSQKLTEGKAYYFGVQANAANEANNSRVVYEYLMLTPLGDLPSAAIVGSTVTTSSCIAVSYRIANTQGQSNVRYGLCWSADGTPTIDNTLQYGPELPTNGSAVTQVIPNALLEYGKTYNIRAFVSTSTGTYYSGPATGALGTAPAAITLTWNKLTKSSLHADIEVYETTSTLNGKNFHAWYAVADLSKGNVEVRVNIPSSTATIDAQAASFGGDCYVMVNGGYFYNGSHTGLGVVGSVVTGATPAVRGSLNTSETVEYATMYNVTRGVFGVDGSGSPAVYWTGSNSGATYYYDRPLPSLKGEAKYAAVTSQNPAAPVTWSPKYALSAGPVLLKDGKCPFDFTETTKGSDYYYSNYEIIPYDIFGPTVSPDRTAVGYLEDGRVILFICDGRITASGGATLLELARILKGLGCVAAVNLDGGGSTGMMAGTEHLNDQTGGNRAVVSTIGFFKKK